MQLGSQLRRVPARSVVGSGCRWGAGIPGGLGAAGSGDRVRRSTGKPSTLRGIDEDPTWAAHGRWGDRHAEIGAQRRQGAEITIAAARLPRKLTRTVPIPADRRGTASRRATVGPTATAADRRQPRQASPAVRAEPTAGSQEGDRDEERQEGRSDSTAGANSHRNRSGEYGRASGRSAVHYKALRAGSQGVVVLLRPPLLKGCVEDRSCLRSSVDLLRGWARRSGA